MPKLIYLKIIFILFIFGIHGLSAQLNAPALDANFDFLVFSLDGSVSAVTNGEVSWTMRTGGPILSSSHDKLGVVSSEEMDDSNFGILPSTNGSLYRFSSESGLQKLPVTLRQLLELSPFHAPDGTLFVSSKTSVLNVVDRETGLPICKKGHSGSSLNCVTESSDTLSIGRVDHIIRALTEDTGEERWNVTFAEFRPSITKPSIQTNLGTRRERAFQALSTPDGFLYLSAFQTPIRFPSPPLLVYHSPLLGSGKRVYERVPLQMVVDASSVPSVFTRKEFNTIRQLVYVGISNHRLYIYDSPMSLLFPNDQSNSLYRHSTASGSKSSSSLLDGEKYGPLATLAPTSLGGGEKKSTLPTSKKNSNKDDGFFVVSLTPDNQWQQNEISSSKISEFPIIENKIRKENNEFQSLLPSSSSNDELSGQNEESEENFEENNLVFQAWQPPTGLHVTTTTIQTTTPLDHQENQKISSSHIEIENQKCDPKVVGTDSWCENPWWENIHQLVATATDSHDHPTLKNSILPHSNNKMNSTTFLEPSPIIPDVNLTTSQKTVSISTQPFFDFLSPEITIIWILVFLLFLAIGFSLLRSSSFVVAKNEKEIVDPTIEKNFEKMEPKAQSEPSIAHASDQLPSLKNIESEEKEKEKISDKDQEGGGVQNQPPLPATPTKPTPTKQQSKNSKSGKQQKSKNSAGTPGIEPTTLPPHAAYLSLIEQKEQKDRQMKSKGSVVSEDGGDALKLSESRFKLVNGLLNSSRQSRLWDLFAHLSKKPEKEKNPSKPHAQKISKKESMGDEKGSGEESGKQVGRLFVYDKVLGYGSHGTIVYLGELDGRKVAVKRMLSQFYEIANKEISLLIESDQHPNVVRYFAKEDDGQFIYLALELCSHTLSDLFEPPSPSVSKDTVFKDTVSKDTLSNGELLVDLLRQLANGIFHLHSLNIAHRDLKPGNVLIMPGNKVKISDMGLGKQLSSGASSFATDVFGTFGWQPAEVLTRQGRLTKSVDVFSFGCIVYYVMSRGKHPFGDRFEREFNILKGNFVLDDLRECPEAADLVAWTLQLDFTLRPTAQQVLTHPFFWTADQKLSFLSDVSDQFGKEKCAPPILHFLESRSFLIFNNTSLQWDTKLDACLKLDMHKFRNYDFKSVRELLRCMRNIRNHYREYSEEVQKILNPPDGVLHYFLQKHMFPTLFFEVYCAVRQHWSAHPMFVKYFSS